MAVSSVRHRSAAWGLNHRPRLRLRAVQRPRLWSRCGHSGREQRWPVPVDPGVTGRIRHWLEAASPLGSAFAGISETGSVGPFSRAFKELSEMPAGLKRTDSGMGNWIRKFTAQTLISKYQDHWVIDMERSGHEDGRRRWRNAGP